MSPKAFSVGAFAAPALVTLLLSPLGCSGCRDKTVANADAGLAATPSASASSSTASLFPAPPELPLPEDPGPGWEGSIRMGLRGPSQREDVRIFFTIKGDRVRYDAPIAYKGIEAVTVVDVALRRLVLFPKEGEKEYRRFELPPDPADAATFPLPSTGKKETVLGLECDVYELKRGKASSTACIHEGIAFVEPSMAAMGVTPPRWVHALSLSKRFLVRGLEVDEQGRETFRLEAKAIAAGPPRIPLNAPLGYVQAKGKIPGSPFRPGLPD